MTEQHERLDSLSDEYLDSPEDRDVDIKVEQLLADYLLPRLRGSSVLEMGIGDQIWTPKLLKHFQNVTTVEGSPEMIARAVERIDDPRWKPIHSLFEHYHPPEKFDLVVSTYVFEHIQDPSVILGLIRDEWLVPGGQLLIVVPHALSLHRRLAVSMGIANQPGELSELDRRLGHFHNFSWYQVNVMLDQAGFVVREKKGFFLKLFPNVLLQHCSSEQIEGMFKLGMEMPIDFAAVISFLAETEVE